MKLKVITSNPGKVAEYEKELSQFGIEIISATPTTRSRPPISRRS